MTTCTNTSPDTVEDSPILEDPQQLVVRGDIMEVGSFLVGKEEVGLPYGVQHGRVQVEGGIWVFTIRQPRVIPLLPQEDVHSVILQR